MVSGKPSAFLKLVALVVLLGLLFGISLPLRTASAGNVRVPEDYPTIQAAIDAAVDGDVIVIAPGTYYENLVIADKTITLTSHFYTTGDRQYITSTIIDGQLQDPVILVEATVGPETTIQGLSILNGTDGIRAFAPLMVLDNYFYGNDDSLDYTDSGGILRGNLIEFSTDDAVDFDFATQGIVENNILQENKDDGIEIRMQDYTGPELNIIIRNNQILHNNSDGIQLIGYPNLSNRKFRIEHNLIKDNRKAGLGLMDGGITSEDYRGASLLEPIYVLNNSFIANLYGISGGDNMAAVNNIIANSKEMGVNKVDGGSVLAYNLLWNNVVENTGSNLDPLTTWYVNPLLTAENGLQPGSPAVDAGITQFEFGGAQIFNYPPGSYFGAAPDLGWMDMNLDNQPTPSITPSQTLTPSPTPGCSHSLVIPMQADATISGGSPDANYGAGAVLSADSDPQENFLLKFNVSDLGDGEIEQAVLKLYNVNESTKGGDFYRVLDSSWAEGTVTWNNVPAAETSPVVSLGAVAINSWVSIDLSAVVSGEGTYSFRVASTTSNAAKYSSKEGGYPPYLELAVAGEVPDPDCTATVTPSATHTLTPSPTATHNPDGSIQFAVIGDYGDHTQSEANVAALVAGWNPDLVVTTGDNNYPAGSATTIDQNIGQFYQSFIYPYVGSYGPGATVNRFFPSLGNHDLDSNAGQPYLDYFTLPGNERYYDFVWGPVHFFMLDSDPREPDGYNSSSVQANWLAPRLAASTAPWQVVVFHHAPYSSGAHGSTTALRWPFAAWGADAVLSGHDHLYERLTVNGIPYFVNGMGGDNLYDFDVILPESQVRYNTIPGAMLVNASNTQITFDFYNTDHELIDAYTVNHPSPPTATATVSATPSATPSATSAPTETTTPTHTPVPSATATLATPPVYQVFLPLITAP